MFALGALSLKEGRFCLTLSKRELILYNKENFMRKTIGAILFLFLFCPLWSQQPVTQVTVSRPTTNVSVYRPATSVTVSRPTTQVSVFRPTTQTEVSRPTTQTEVSRPTTSVAASRPVTVLSSGAAQQSNSASESKKTATPSSQAQTSMSDYKPLQAKNFQAPSASASLGGGAAGLGNKINQAEKDASAASSQAPKAVSPSGVSAADVVAAPSDQKVGGNTLLNLLKQKAAGKSASKRDTK